MPLSEPLVSIGMPVRNGADHLRGALESLRSQTYHHFEIFISDNASTDATREICEEYAKKDPRVRFVRHEKNIGAIPNFAFLKQNASGDYFMWAAYDDLWDPRFLASCVGVLERDPSLALVMSDFNRFDMESGVVEHYHALESVPEEHELYARLKRHILMYLSRGKGVPIYGVWRRKMIEDVPLPNDWDFFPVRFIFAALFKGAAVPIRETLFFKRAPLPKDSLRRPLPLRVWFTFWDRIRKVSRRLFYANMRAITVSRRLTLSEKIRLVFWQCAVAVRLFLVRTT